jgi:hypothetical protein
MFFTFRVDAASACKSPFIDFVALYFLFSSFLFFNSGVGAVAAWKFPFLDFVPLFWISLSFSFITWFFSVEFFRHEQWIRLDQSPFVELGIRLHIFDRTIRWYVLQFVKKMVNKS